MMLWGLFELVGFTPYFEAMEGYNEELSYRFVNAWSNGEVTMGGVHFKVTKWQAYHMKENKLQKRA